MDSFGSALKDIESHPGYSEITDQKMLDLLTKKDNISSTMMTIKGPNKDVYANIEKLLLAFVVKSKKHQDIAKKNMEIIGVNPSEHFLSLFGTQEEALPITPQDKKGLDAIDHDILKPSQKRLDALANLLGSYSRASEYRADDFAVINATHPEIYPKTLNNVMTHVTDVQSQFLTEMKGLEPADKPLFVSHPSIDLRADRAERLIKRIKSAKEMCGEVNVDAAIIAVNKEMSANQKNAASTDFPRH